MGTVASQITSLRIVYTTVYSDADQRKHQSSASLAFVWGIHRGPVNSPHKWPVTRKIFPFDDVIMSDPRLPPFQKQWRILVRFSKPWQDKIRWGSITIRYYAEQETLTQKPIDRKLWHMMGDEIHKMRREMADHKKIEHNTNEFWIKTPHIRCIGFQNLNNRQSLQEQDRPFHLSNMEKH